MKTSELIEAAKGEITATIGLELDSISSVRNDGDHWVIHADMLELRITPNTQDVLGVYEVLLDADANLLSYHRIGRHRRSQLEIERADG
jgi:hypothetical protein